MSLRFRPKRSHKGFDGHATPQTQIIPAGETRTIFVTGRDDLVPRFRFAGDVEPLFPDTSSRRRRMQLDLKGTTPASNIVEWVPEKRYQGSVPDSRLLRVHVLPSLTFRTAFNFVTDGPGGTGRTEKTNRKAREVRRIVAEAHRILQPQANIIIETSMIREDVTLKQALGKEITPKSGPVAPGEIGHWKTVTDEGEKSADLNVFFVWNLNFQNAWHEATLGLSRAGEANILIEDSNKVVRDPLKGPPGATLAHELLHVLGRGAHSPKREHLMAESYEPGGIFIPSNDVIFAHTYARHRNLGKFQTKF